MIIAVVRGCYAKGMTLPNFTNSVAPHNFYSEVSCSVAIVPDTTEFQIAQKSSLTPFAKSAVMQRSAFDRTKSLFAIG